MNEISLRVHLTGRTIKTTLVIVGFLYWLYAICITPRLITMYNAFHIDEDYALFFHCIRVALPLLAFMHIIGIMLFHKKKNILLPAKFSCLFQLSIMVLYAIVFMK